MGGWGETLWTPSIKHSYWNTVSNHTKDIFTISDFSVLELEFIYKFRVSEIATRRSFAFQSWKIFNWTSSTSTSSLRRGKFCVPMEYFRLWESSIFLVKLHLHLSNLIKWKSWWSWQNKLLWKITRFSITTIQLAFNGFGNIANRHKNTDIIAN